MVRKAHAERARRRKKVPPTVWEEKQPSPFPSRAFWAGPRAVFSGQIKDLGLTSTYSEFASIWYCSRSPHRNSALPLDGPVNCCASTHFGENQLALERSCPSLRACTKASRATLLATTPGAFPQGCPKVPPPNYSTESSPKISVRAGICQT
eukprot:Gb_11951 [translate_table: standard]